MIEVVRKFQVDGCDVPDVSFLDSLAILVLLRNEYFVVSTLSTGCFSSLLTILDSPLMPRFILTYRWHT